MSKVRRKKPTEMMTKFIMRANQLLGSGVLGRVNVRAAVGLGDNDAPVEPDVSLLCHNMRGKDVMPPMIWAQFERKKSDSWRAVFERAIAGRRAVSGGNDCDALPIAVVSSDSGPAVIMKQEHWLFFMRTAIEAESRSQNHVDAILDELLANATEEA